jgi:hypothetical protein
MAQTCKIKKCGKPTGGFTYCPGHRKIAAAYNKVSRERDPDAYRERRRAFLARYYRTRKGKEYLERNRAVRLEASRVWQQSNHDRKRLHADLVRAIRAGTIKKPPHCQDCGLEKKPIVAYGLSQGTNGVEVEAWLCWGCWHKRKREDEGRP